MSKNTFAEKIFIIGAIAVDAIIAYFFLFKQSLRLDEAQSLWQTSRTPAVLLKLVSEDVHVPLYHLALHYWELFFGTSLVAVRSLSLIFFLATIPCFYLLAKEAIRPPSSNPDSRGTQLDRRGFAGRDTIIFATALLAFSPFLNWYGSETRMYSLMVLLTVVNMYFFLRLFKRPSTGAWVGYFISAFFGMFSHYFFFFNFIVQLIFFLFNRSVFPPKAGKNFGIIAAILAVLFLPWVYLVYKNGFAAMTQPLLSVPNSGNVFNTYAEFLFGFQDEHFNTLLVSLWPLTMLFGIFALSKRKQRSSDNAARQAKTAQNSQVAQNYYFLLMSFLPIILGFFISLAIKPIYDTRYFIITVPALYLFLSWFTSTFPNLLRQGFRIILILVMILTLANQTVSAHTPVKENFSAAVAYLQNHAGPGDAIVLVPPFIIYPFEYYYTGQAQLLSIPPWDRYSNQGQPPFNASQLPNYVQSVDANHRIVWVLLSDDNDQGYNTQVRLYYDEHFQRVDHQEFQPTISLYAYRVSY